MWLMVMFDLPVLTKKERKDAADFRKFLISKGYLRLQYSVYARPCPSEENAAVHRKAVSGALPPDGQVRVLTFTDKQFGRMQVYFGKKAGSAEKQPEQITFF